MVNLVWVKRPIKRLLALFLVLCLGIGIMAPIAVAKEPAQPEISLQQAIDKALATNEGIKKADKEVDRTSELRDYSADQLDYAPTGPATTSAAASPWLSLISADLSWQTSKRSLTTQEDSVIISVCNKYWTILKDQEKVKVAELGVKTALMQMQNAQAGKRVGTLDDVSLLGVETQYKAALTTLSTAQNDLDTAYNSFNNLIGLWSIDRPVLTDSVQYKPIEVANLDNEVARVLETSPTIWSKEDTVAMQKNQKSISIYSSAYQPYKAREITVEQAELDLASAKKTAEQTTRSTYYAIITMEDNYAKTQESLKVAEEDLRIAKVKFDVGMATSTDVITAEKAVADLRSSLVDMACAHEYTKLTFEKPWVTAS